MEQSESKAFDGVKTEKQLKGYLKRTLPTLEVRTTELGDGHRVASVNLLDAATRLLEEHQVVQEAAIKKSEAWKKGDKWKKLETEKLGEVDSGSVMRNHAHLMRPAAPDEEFDLRLAAVLYADEVETVDTGYAKSKHKLLAVQVTFANLPIDVRFDHDVMILLAIARHPAVMKWGQAGIFAGLAQVWHRSGKAHTPAA